MFKLHKLNEKFKVKEKFKNDDFIWIKLIIKRYYKKILADNLDIEKTRSRSLSKKTMEFRKGDKVKRKNSKFRTETFKNQGRIERVHSDNVRP